MLLQVTAPHYCAGIILDEDQYVVGAAPILSWTIGWKARKLIGYFKSKGFKVQIVEMN